MVPYGKTAANAVSAVSYLAERYGDPSARTSSAAIAENRRISKPLVAKILTILSQAGIVGGSPGPGGGYSLAKPPEQVFLMDVVRHFEKVETGSRCPFGPHWCGNFDPCPIHDQIVELDEIGRRFMEETSFDVFVHEA